MLEAPSRELTAEDAPNHTEPKMFRCEGLPSEYHPYKNGRSYFKYIREIAEYLDVTPGYLLNGKDDEMTYESLNGDETRLLTLYRKLDESGRGTVMDVVDRFV